MAAVKRKGGDGMKRNVDLNEISDGRLYSANDMVKVECGDCAGCSDHPRRFDVRPLRKQHTRAAATARGKSGK